MPIEEESVVSITTIFDYCENTILTRHNSQICSETGKRFFLLKNTIASPDPAKDWAIIWSRVEKCRLLATGKSCSGDYLIHSQSMIQTLPEEDAVKNHIYRQVQKTKCVWWDDLFEHLEAEFKLRTPNETALIDFCLSHPPMFFKLSRTLSMNQADMDLVVSWIRHYLGTAVPTSQNSKVIFGDKVFFSLFAIHTAMPMDLSYLDLVRLVENTQGFLITEAHLQATNILARMASETETEQAIITCLEVKKSQRLTPKELFSDLPDPVRNRVRSKNGLCNFIRDSSDKSVLVDGLISLRSQPPKTCSRSVLSSPDSGYATDQKKNAASVWKPFQSVEDFSPTSGKVQSGIYLSDSMEDLLRPVADMQLRPAVVIGLSGDSSDLEEEEESSRNHSYPIVSESEDEK